MDLIDLRMHARAPKFNTYHNYYYIGARTTKATSFLGNEKCKRKFNAMQHYHRSMLSTIVQGDAQLERGDYQLATESYSKAMELDPSSPVFPASKAKALFQLQL